MSVPEGRDYSRYDQMSTAELEQLLRLDFQASEAGDSDLDAILYLSDLLARRNGPPDAEAAWAQFQTKYRPCADGHSLYDLDDSQEPEQPPSAVRPRRPRRLRRLALLAAVLAALLLGGMAAQAAGVDLLGAIAQWSDETFHFVPANSDPAGTGSNLFQTALQSRGLEDRFPARCLDGFYPSELNVTQLSNCVSAYMNYSGEDRIYSVVVIHDTQPAGNTGIFEKDDTPVEVYNHNSQTFYILSNIDTLTATAYDGAFMTIIAGVLTREEIKTIIDSIPDPRSAQDPAQDAPAEEEPLPYSPRIPEGFERYKMDYYSDPINQTTGWSAWYRRENDRLVFGQTTGASAPPSEQDGAPAEEYVFHGVTHYIFNSAGTIKAVWTVGDTQYYLRAAEGTVDIKALIRSVYESE